MFCCIYIIYIFICLFLVLFCLTCVVCVCVNAGCHPGVSDAGEHHRQLDLRGECPNKPGLRLLGKSLDKPVKASRDLRCPTAWAIQLWWKRDSPVPWNDQDAPREPNHATNPHPPTPAPTQKIWLDVCVRVQHKYPQPQNRNTHAWTRKQWAGAVHSNYLKAYIKPHLGQPFRVGPFEARASPPTALKIMKPPNLAY